MKRGKIKRAPRARRARVLLAVAAGMSLAALGGCDNGITGNTFDFGIPDMSTTSSDGGTRR
jgi:hypothetical protein